MIRIYLDWNIISYLKTDPYKEIRDFIDSHKDRFVFPYTASHFQDLMKGYHPENHKLEQDVALLDYLSSGYYLELVEGRVKPMIGSPRADFEDSKDSGSYSIAELFQGDDEDPIITLLLSILQNLPIPWDMQGEGAAYIKQMFPDLPDSPVLMDIMKELDPQANNFVFKGKLYKDFRKEMSGAGMDLGVNAGNWKVEDVINNIDTFLEELQSGLTFIEYVKMALVKDKPQTRYHFFTQAYLLLDMMGFKRDKLKKATDNMLNIHADAEHAFYAAHCDYFIAADKNLRLKAKALYHKLGIQTKVLDPSEFIEVVSSRILDLDNSTSSILGLFGDVIQNDDAVSVEQVVDKDIELISYNLPVFLFDYFDELVMVKSTINNNFAFILGRTENNYSKFLFYSEVEAVVNKVSQYFGGASYVVSEEIMECFKSWEKEITIVWTVGSMHVELRKPKESVYPSLNFTFYKGGEEEKVALS